MSAEPTPEKKLRLQGRLLNLLRQGATPKRLAASIAVGVVMGLFPVLGVTTMLCVAAGYAFRLNHPGLQLANYGISPLQLPVMLVLIKTGDWVFGMQTIPYDLDAIQAAASTDFTKFAMTFWRAGIHGIAMWVLGAIPLGLAVYFPSHAMLLKLAKKS